VISSHVFFFEHVLITSMLGVIHPWKFCNLVNECLLHVSVSYRAGYLLAL
jgi:hypothetical protein